MGFFFHFTAINYKHYIIDCYTCFGDIRWKDELTIEETEEKFDMMMRGRWKTGGKMEEGVTRDAWDDAMMRVGFLLWIMHETMIRRNGDEKCWNWWHEWENGGWKKKIKTKKIVFYFLPPIYLLFCRWGWGQLSARWARIGFKYIQSQSRSYNNLGPNTVGGECGLVWWTRTLSYNAI